MRMRQHGRVKQICLMILMGMLLFGAQQHVAANEDPGALTYPNQALEAFIDIRITGDEYDEAEAQRIIDRLGSLPEKMVEEAVRQDGVLILTDGPITDVEELNYLKGRTPDGWEDTGLTWEDVPGAGGEMTVVRIGYSYRKDAHDAANLEYHEIAHGLDALVLDDRISNHPEFEEIFKEEKENIFPNFVPGNEYYDMITEYFAETMARYYEGDHFKQRLQEKAPKTYAFIEELPQRILYADTDDDVVQLSWEADKKAAAYEVFRDGELVAETKEASYEDRSIEQEGSYTYTVTAVDQSDNPLYETFERDVMDAPAYTTPPEEEEEREPIKNMAEHTSPSMMGTVGYYWGIIWFYLIH